jgi:hypothetical protein
MMDEDMLDSAEERLEDSIAAVKKIQSRFLQMRDERRRLRVVK